MTEKLNIDDVQEKQASRDDNGELIPRTEEIEWGDETKEIDVYPITGGLGNQIAKHERGLNELDPEAVAAVVRAACPNLTDMTADDIEALPLEYIEALIGPITSQLPEVDAGGN